MLDKEIDKNYSEYFVQEMFGPAIGVRVCAENKSKICQRAIKGAEQKRFRAEGSDIVRARVKVSSALIVNQCRQQPTTRVRQSVHRGIDAPNAAHTRSQ